MGRAGERPLFLADWERVVFVHFAVDPAALRPLVPFELDLHDGRAYVSLVAFTQRNLRPALGAGTRLGAALARPLAALGRPLAEHEFFNVRTYVRRGGERGIYFLAEWIPNRLDAFVGPHTYGLPYRLGRLDYRHDRPAGIVRGRVRAAGPNSVNEAAYAGEFNSSARFGTVTPGSLDEFLLERYTAYTLRRGAARRFRIRHGPWPQADAFVELTATRLLEQTGPWLSHARPAGAHYSPGVRDVSIGAPHKLQTRPNGSRC
jgi:uncharacterized protein YqjF (DUF2071 family)